MGEILYKGSFTSSGYGMDRFGSLLGILLCFVWQITTEWMALLAGPWLVSSVCFTAVAVLNYIHTCIDIHIDQTELYLTLL